MCHILQTIGPPVGILTFWITFASILWPWQARNGKDKGGPTDAHSERIYKDFEFSFKAFLPIIGGFGYVRLEKYQGKEDLARHAMIGLGAIGLGVAWIFGLFIICHQGSKLRRWEDIEWAKMPFWQEIWMCVAMLGFASALWIAALQW
jgi:hypothetical protein